MVLLRIEAELIKGFWFPPKHCDSFFGYFVISPTKGIKNNSMFGIFIDLKQLLTPSGCSAMWLTSSLPSAGDRQGKSGTVRTVVTAASLAHPLRECEEFFFPRVMFKCLLPFRLRPDTKRSRHAAKTEQTRKLASSLKPILCVANEKCITFKSGCSRLMAYFFLFDFVFNIHVNKCEQLRPPLFTDVRHLEGQKKCLRSLFKLLKDAFGRFGQQHDVNHVDCRKMCENYYPLFASLLT